MTNKIVTRFAPSPSGYLHLGHAYSALFAWHAAKKAQGKFILRIEDIDGGRCRTEFEEAIFEDLRWLSLQWDEPVRRQSDCMEDYAKALDTLDRMGLLYPCFCTRKDIREEIQRAGQAPHLAPNGPEGAPYPGTCAKLSDQVRQDRIFSGEPYALRLHMVDALEHAGPHTWVDQEKGVVSARPKVFGDVVLARKDIKTSYHLACTVDDHLQGITLVIRGEDLFAATHVHCLLQALLGFETPRYHHHPLLTDDEGKRFAKRDESLTLRHLREAGKTPGDIRRMVEI